MPRLRIMIDVPDDHPWLQLGTVDVVVDGVIVAAAYNGCDDDLGDVDFSGEVTA